MMMMGSRVKSNGHVPRNLLLQMSSFRVMSSVSLSIFISSFLAKKKRKKKVEDGTGRERVSW